MRDILPIYTYNHPVLRTRTSPVEDMTDELSAFIDNMFHTMTNAKGIGLAANQVGRSQAFTVIDIDDADDDSATSGPLVLINPVIEAYSDDVEESEEGCLSLPEYRDKVVRPSAIQVRFLDRAMRERVMETAGLLARVIQHEVDHLNGIYFFERLTPIRRTLGQSRLRRIAKGEYVPDYPIHTDAP
jgi:peptide deformylase